MSLCLGFDHRVILVESGGNRLRFLNIATLIAANLDEPTAAVILQSMIRRSLRQRSWRDWHHAYRVMVGRVLSRVKSSAKGSQLVMQTLAEATAEANKARRLVLKAAFQQQLESALFNSNGESPTDLGRFVWDGTLLSLSPSIANLAPMLTAERLRDAESIPALRKLLSTCALASCIVLSVRLLGSESVIPCL